MFIRTQLGDWIDMNRVIMISPNGLLDGDVLKREHPSWYERPYHVGATIDGAGRFFDASIICGTFDTREEAQAYADELASQIIDAALKE